MSTANGVEVDQTGAPKREPKPAFCVAVLGARDLLAADEVARLVQVLVGRYRPSHQIVCLSVGPDGPDCSWARGLMWSVTFVPCSRGPVRRDCEIIAWADAIMVLGDPNRWRRVLALAVEAGIPTRVFRTRPKWFPPRPDFDVR